MLLIFNVNSGRAKRHRFSPVNSLNVFFLAA